MKRGGLQAVETQFSDLPWDTVVLILAYSKWRDCGQLARASRNWMRRLTSTDVVGIILDLHRTEPFEEKSLPEWLFFSLPASLIGGAAQFTWQQYVDGRDNLVFPKDLANERYFYTGGDVAKRLYNRRWEDSDIDVWTSDAALAGVDAGTEWDFVVKSPSKKPTQRCIESFDMSVVQQGFLQSGAGEEPEFYATPLTVYTYHSGELLISIHPLFAGDYTEVLTTETLRAHNVIRSRIEGHRWHEHSKIGHAFFSDTHSERLREESPALHYCTEKFKLNEFFENCEMCMATMMERHLPACYGNNVDGVQVAQYLMENNTAELMTPIVRWTKRVMKYRNRFADFKSRYVANPFVARQLAAIQAEVEERSLVKVHCDQCQSTTVMYLTDGFYGPCDACSDWVTYDSDLAKTMCDGK